MSTTLLVDGDILLWQSSYVSEESIDWGDGITSTTLNLDAAKEGITSSIKSLIERTKTDRAIICLTNDKNFRYVVLPSYKHNRAETEKPKLYTDLKLFLTETQEVKTKEWLEADDVMGILGSSNPKKYIIATIDKDLKQIPGRHFNWKHDTKVRTVTKEEADKYFYTQILTGDTTDGYGGCPGIGPKKAYKIIEENWPNPWPAIVEAYKAKGLTEEEALVQARVARILRYGEFKAGKPILWMPE